MNFKSDGELVRMALKNSDNFVYLVERYESRLIRYVLRISSFDVATAEDVVQDVFISVYKNLNDFDRDLSFSSWIYRIAHNTVIDYVRKFKSRPMQVELDDDYVFLLPNDVDLPEEMSRKELSVFVKKILLELPEKYREVLVLRYLEDKSYKEIGDILRKSVNSVSVLINRAKDKMKAKLKSIN